MKIRKGRKFLGLVLALVLVVATLSGNWVVPVAEVEAAETEYMPFDSFQHYIGDWYMNFIPLIQVSYDITDMVSVMDLENKDYTMWFQLDFLDGGESFGRTGELNPEFEGEQGPKLVFRTTDGILGETEIQPYTETTNFGALRTNMTFALSSVGDEGRHLLSLIKRAVENGTLQYVILSAPVTGVVSSVFTECDLYEMEYSDGGHGLVQPPLLRFEGEARNLADPSWIAIDNGGVFARGGDVEYKEEFDVYDIKWKSINVPPSPSPSTEPTVGPPTPDPSSPPTTQPSTEPTLAPSAQPTPTITPPPPTKILKPTKVTVKKKLTIKVGKKKTLKAKLSPKGISKAWAKLTWKSSKKKIATVNKKGIVTAKKKGSCKITVKTVNSKKAVCRVKVKK